MKAKDNRRVYKGKDDFLRLPTTFGIKVARYPVFSRSTNLESKLIVFFVLLKF